MLLLPLRSGGYTSLNLLPFLCVCVIMSKGIVVVSLLFNFVYCWFLLLSFIYHGFLPSVPTPHCVESVYSLQYYYIAYSLAWPNWGQFYSSFFYDGCKLCGWPFLYCLINIQGNNCIHRVNMRYHNNDSWFVHACLCIYELLYIYVHVWKLNLISNVKSCQGPPRSVPVQLISIKEQEFW